MAQDAVDTVVERFGLDAVYVSRTNDLLLVGYESNPQEKAEALSKTYGLGLDTTKRLVQDYGSRATDLLAEVLTLNVPLAQGHTYLESEVVFACRHEFALSAIDVLCRRTRLGLEDQHAAKLAIPRVIQLMGDELGWSVAQREEEERRARVQLEQYATFSD
jgi:glycerol-3-phosphate dehydrogenase